MKNCLIIGLFTSTKVPACTVPSYGDSLDIEASATTGCTSDTEQII